MEYNNARDVCRAAPEFLYSGKQITKLQQNNNYRTTVKILKAEVYMQCYFNFNCPNFLFCSEINWL